MFSLSPSSCPAHTGQNSTTISNVQAVPPPLCCSSLPEGAQVLPGGNDCYLQDTLHITSTPFGVFRPSSFCCISHFALRSRALKDQGVLFTGESRQGDRDTFFLPRTSLRALWRHSKHATVATKTGTHDLHHEGCSRSEHLLGHSFKGQNYLK